jgi:hypothetical protein
MTATASARLQTPMSFIPAAIGACVLLPLISQFATAQTAQQDQSMTATASAPSKSDACTASMGKAYSLLGFCAEPKKRYGRKRNS